MPVRFITDLLNFGVLRCKNSCFWLFLPLFDKIVLKKTQSLAAESGPYLSIFRMNAVCLLDIGDHLKPAGMPYALELGSKESADDIFGQLAADNAGSERDNVRVIVLYGHSRGIRLAAHARADSRNLVGGK